MSGRAYGHGWECERGYRKIDDGCLQIEVPENGYLSERAYNKGWKCDRGYKMEEDKCAFVELPENAYLSDKGDRWQCAREFHRQGDMCILR